MRATEAVADARRFTEICNACRYCESYCAVFPAIEQQRDFTNQDMAYFANLCHNCQGCYHACQYAPPHEFGINLPKTFAEVRQQSYAEYAWPPGAGRLFEKNGTLVSLLTAAAIALVIILTMAFHDLASLTRARSGPGSFYAVIPWGVMVAVAGVTFGYGMIALFAGAVRFWLATRSSLTKPLTLRAIGRALHDIFTLRYLGGDGHGCNDTSDSFAQKRRWFHHLTFYGFLLCFASTSVATIYDHWLGLIAPYPFFSIPVQLGTWGGIGIVIGVAGLLWIKIIADQAPVARVLMGGEFAFSILLWLTAFTGLLLLALRDTGAMPILLAVHLGVILAFFIALPYSKFVHGIYRATALLKAAIERQH